MPVPSRFARGMVVIILILASASVSFAQIEDQISAYTGINGTGYLQPLADAFGADLNDGLFHSAYIPPTGLHINLELRIMSVIFGDDDKTFSALTEGSFAPEQTVNAPTVVGPGDATLVLGSNGTSFAFPGGFSLHSFALAVPQLRISSFSGTEALIRYFAVNTGDVEIGDISLFGFGIRHSISQYLDPEFPVDVAAGFFWQSFSLGSDLIDSKAFSFGVQAGKRFKKGFTTIEPYGGFSIDRFSMDASYQSKTSGTPIDINLDFEPSTTAHLTFGLSLNLAVADIHAEYNIASQQSFSFGLAFGN